MGPKVQERVGSWVSHARERAAEFLGSEKELLKRLAVELHGRESLDGGEVITIIEARVRTNTA